MEPDPVKDAQKIQSHQLNKNLLMNKGAQAISEPQLEIFADDVQCAHGSATGQLSEDELFYLVSRGIKPERAKQLIQEAFVGDIILKIGDEALRAHIQKEITHEL